MNFDLIFRQVNDPINCNSRSGVNGRLRFAILSQRTVGDFGDPLNFATVRVPIGIVANLAANDGCVGLRFAGASVIGCCELRCQPFGNKEASVRGINSVLALCRGFITILETNHPSNSSIRSPLVKIPC